MTGGTPAWTAAHAWRTRLLACGGSGNGRGGRGQGTPGSWRGPMLKAWRPVHCHWGGGAPGRAGQRAARPAATAPRQHVLAHRSLGGHDHAGCDCATKAGASLPTNPARAWAAPPVRSNLRHARSDSEPGTARGAHTAAPAGRPPGPLAGSNPLQPATPTQAHPSTPPHPNPRHDGGGARCSGGGLHTAVPAAAQRRPAQRASCLGAARGPRPRGRGGGIGGRRRCARARRARPNARP